MPEVTFYHSCAPMYQSLLKQKTYCYVVWTSDLLISRSEKLRSKNYIARDSSPEVRFVTLLGPVSWTQYRSAIPTAKKLVMVVKAYSRH